jgi:hypothetical protein
MMIVRIQTLVANIAVASIYIDHKNVRVQTKPHNFHPAGVGCMVTLIWASGIAG